MTDYAILTQHLTKSYNHRPAVDDLNLRVPLGSIYGFLGRNGAGKTTTIRLLMGLASPTSGTAYVMGMRSPASRSQILTQTGYVPERKLLFPNLTGDELVRFNQSLFPRWSGGSTSKYVKLFDIPMKQPFKTLSLGNQTKLCLLVALAQGADLLVLDEPTTSLDPVMMDDLLRVLIEDHTGENHTIFISSHVLAEIEKIADWIGIIDRGKLLLEARLDDIRADYRRVRVLGTGLPLDTTTQIISVYEENGIVDYYVSTRVQEFAAGLRNCGATVLDIWPVPLQELFLQLMRRS